MVIEARENLKAHGFNMGTIIDFGISTRYRRCWAKCYKKGPNSFVIKVNSEILRGHPSSIRDTIYHEVIHTCKGCFNHGPNFKYAANVCNVNFGTHVQVGCTIDEMMNGKKVGA